MLSPWSSNDLESLRQIAQQLLGDGSSKAYLSTGEHALFAEALKYGPQTWAKFLLGEIPCTVRVTEQTKAEGTPTVISHEADALQLAFRVRFMLYDVAIPGLYGQPVFQPTPATTAVTTTKTAEDDEYDDEDEPNTEMVPEVLDVAAEEDDNKALTRTLANYNKMFHSFEGDWDTMLKYKKLQQNDREIEFEEPQQEKLSSSVQFGAANLSLKHLLGAIEQKRDDLNLTDVELRNLISDVRKNRSKWASEDRIGQEELYEACEKVVGELRATTEHSTAFLNKVSKRDAPNYYQVITYPMDLNTVMKKLKGMQYNSKKEFVDDLMIIWENCLTYNSDPKHFLRAHALAMRKKTLALIPLIPDILVRSREEVEAEAQAEAEAEQEQEQEREAEGAGKGKSKKRRTEPKEGEDKGGEKESTPAPNGDSKDADEVKGEAKGDTKGTPGEAQTPAEELPHKLASGTSGASATPGDPSSAAEDPDAPAADPEAGSNPGSPQPEEHELDSDWESSVWRKSLTTKRSDYLYQRHQLFRHNRIQPNAPVLVRSGATMARFAELQRRFFAKDKPQRAEDDPLFEYDVTSAVPAALQGSVAAPLPSMQDLQATKMIAHGALNATYNKNLNEIQKIRRLSSKIHMIRELQQNPQQYVPQEPPKYPEIKEPEPDVSSRLPGAETMYKPAIQATMRRSVSKVAMAAGFEACQISALDLLNDVASDYLFNTAKLLRETLEGEAERGSDSDAVKGALRNMGVPKLGTLTRYVGNDVVKYNKRLLDLKAQVSSMLTQMLRPAGLDKYNDGEFKDNSDQFVLGQFSNDLGDDYFGFKEMGIDKELGLENIAIPFHLLKQKVAPEQPSQVAHNSRFVQDLPEYPAVTEEALKNIVGVARSWYERCFANRVHVQNGELLEDAKLNSKQKFARAKVPVTGKVVLKRKPKSHLFIRPKSEPVEPPVAALGPGGASAPGAPPDLPGDLDLSLGPKQEFDLDMVDFDGL